MKGLSVSILHEATENEPFIVLDKPSGLPSAPLKTGDDSALTQALALYPYIAGVEGRKSLEKGLVHRIDTATRGCVLIAASQTSYDFFMKKQAEGGFLKYYKASVTPLKAEEIAEMRTDGFPPPPLDYHAMAFGQDFFLESRFRGYGVKHAAVRPVTENAGKAALKKSDETLYRTEIRLMDSYTALCRIRAGYRHQVRCHLAWLGLPVQNDILYNPHCKDSSQGLLSFTACGLEFPNPADGKIMHIGLDNF